MMGIMLLLSAVFIKKRKRFVRRFKIRPMNRNRDFMGAYHHIFMYGRIHDKEQFFKYTRMSPQIFDYILDLVRPYIQRQPRKDTISPAQRLCLTVHYLSQGTSKQESAWNMYVGKTTASEIINETSEVLWHVLCPILMPVPTQEVFKNISKEYFKRWNMPNCIGAVDGKLVEIQNPPASGTLYFSYKKTYSMILMATCDAYYRFTMVDIGTPGSEGDAYSFRESAFGNRLLSKTLPIPPPKCPPNSNTSLPYFLVADQAFPLHENIMRPYPGEYLSEDKNIFNYRLSRARRTIENTFGILVQRWRILRGTIIASEEHCVSIIKACVVLHNLLQRGEEDLPPEERSYCPTGLADYVSADGEIIEGSWRQSGIILPSVGKLGANNATRSCRANREYLKEYLLTDDGCIPQQWNVVNYGGIP